MRGSVRHIRSLLAAVAIAGLICPAAAQERQPIPHRLLAEHTTTLGHLKDLARKNGSIGIAAKHVLTVMVPHDQREEEFVLPLLGLIDKLAEGKVTPDMAWALPMANRLIAERQLLYNEHAAIISALNELSAAARARHDANLVAFAEEAAGEEVNDGEFVYPAALLAGRLVREKLAPK